MQSDHSVRVKFICARSHEHELYVLMLSAVFRRNSVAHLLSLRGSAREEARGVSYSPGSSRAGQMGAERFVPGEQAPRIRAHRSVKGYAGTGRYARAGLFLFVTLYSA